MFRLISKHSNRKKRVKATKRNERATNSESRRKQEIAGFAHAVHEYEIPCNRKYNYFAYRVQLCSRYPFYLPYTGYLK